MKRWKVWITLLAALILILTAARFTPSAAQNPIGTCTGVEIVSFGKYGVPGDSISLPAAMIVQAPDTVLKVDGDRFRVPTFPLALLCTIGRDDSDREVPKVIQLKWR